MEEVNDRFTIRWDKINLVINNRPIEYPLLRVKISGDTSLVEFVKYMSKIESFTESFEGDYISITDFTDLSPNKIIESLISVSSNRLLKSLTFVSNQSKISFVLLGKNSKLTVLRKRLEDVNTITEGGSYAYNYRFVEDEDQMARIAEEFLNQK